ncbi:MAG: tRNA preQ1(34) S-adenosylmethionine ribosyltransferase-isomerase QueA [Acidobacteria bacterium]|nr:MAG: tRNA preQ1(34) S-adenosylmethionine ribosyltransferase-isomerase QueA [Acidobacteriota bacterium]
MRLSDFDYALPAELIAQRPSPDRSAARMLLLERRSGRMEDSLFRELPSRLTGNELIVVNNARVIPARLFAHRLGVRSEPPGKHSSVRREYLSSRVEILLVRRIEPDVWEALVRPGRKVSTGERLFCEGADLEAEVVGRGNYGLRRLRFHTGAEGSVSEIISRIGHMPLPPYIRRSDDATDRELYQTVFAKQPVAVAAPTAGLHFTPEILEQLRQKGIEIAEITLEVGLGTFQPIRTENLENHVMHSEAYEISPQTAAAIASARRQQRPILAVGTTVVRALEDAAQKSIRAGNSPEAITPGRACAELFIRPGHRFALVDQLLTNFHLPRSTLLVLVCAFAGRDPVLSVYRHALATGYRFYSYGDCMLIR